MPSTTGVQPGHDGLEQVLPSLVGELVAAQLVAAVVVLAGVVGLPESGSAPATGTHAVLTMVPDRRSQVPVKPGSTREAPMLPMRR